MEAEDYPIPRVFCGARTRSGGVCKQPAMANGRCRLHGGKSKAGKEHGQFKHGHYTREAVALRKGLRDLLREAQEALMGE
jgi:hypothetical protein